MSEANMVEFYNGEELKHPYTLDQYKKLKLNKISQKTQDILYSTGFTHESKQFRLGVQAEANLVVLEVNAAALTYPQDYTAMDGTKLSLANQTELMSLITSALVAGITHHATARALIDSVNSAADEAAVDAVVDNR